MTLYSREGERSTLADPFVVEVAIRAVQRARPSKLDEDGVATSDAVIGGLTVALETVDMASYRLNIQSTFAYAQTHVVVQSVHVVAILQADLREVVNGQSLRLASNTVVIAGTIAGRTQLGTGDAAAVLGVHAISTAQTTRVSSSIAS